MDGSNGTPDLQAILATLAQFAPPAQTSQPSPNVVGTVSEEHTPSTSVEQSTPVPIAHPQPVAERPTDPCLRRPQSRSATASPKPLIDPASITTWQDGLRCVTKIAAQNAQFATSIKRMMADQRKHEMQWYTERQNLKHTQANRSSSAARAQSILSSLNNNGKPSITTENNVDADAELTNFDRKIHVAQQQMEVAMTLELKGLGVPFFGTDVNLVLSSNDSGETQPSDDRPKWSPLVTESQILDLRRRMVGHLEDLYKD